jgi:malate dehydrogenase (oxaloacetate-decarboxylating)
MLMAAARALADISPARSNVKGNLLPPVSELRDISFRVAQAVAAQARKDGLAELMDTGDMYKRIRDKMWTPKYHRYERTGVGAGI